MKKLFCILVAVVLLTAACAKPADGGDPVPGGASTDEPVIIEPVETSEPAVEPSEPAIEPTEPVVEPSAPVDGIPAAYAAILDEYRAALSAADGAAVGENVSEEWHMYPQPVWYSLCDINADGVSELVILAGQSESEASPYDLWCLDGETAVRPFPDMSFGYRTNFTVLANGTVEVTGSSSAFDSSWEFYTIDGHAATTVSELSAAATPENPATVYTVDGATLSEADFDAALKDLEASGEMTLALTALS